MKIHILKSIGYIGLIIFILFSGIVIASPLLNFVKLYVVQSGSMEPELSVGSLIVVQSQDEYSEGDVITFNMDDSQSTTTHRIVDIEEEQGAMHYIMKGDANEEPDSTFVFKEDIMGEVIFLVPYIGYPVSFAKTEIGFIFLIVIPATLIIYSELVSIRKEAKKMMERRKKKKTQKKESEDSNILNLKEKNEEHN